MITVTPSAAAAIATTGTFVIHAGDASPALLEAQKQAGIDALIKLELTHGEDSYTYTRSRILACDHWTEPYSHRASIVLDNSDGALGDIDLRGYQAVISYGAHISGGDEYAATAPLWVIDQGFDSAPGKLLCTLSAEGIPDRLARDRASAVYAPSASDTSTVKDLINAVLGATIACYSHAAAYDVLWDGEDDLIDSYQPKDSFRIYQSSSRLAVVKRLLDLTGCVIRSGADGKIHVFQPITSGDACDYSYSLERGQHSFFSRSHRNRLVLPNYVVVKTPAQAEYQYSGSAQDSDSVNAIGEVRQYITTYLNSDAQGEEIAGAIIARNRLQQSSGSASVPLNVAARVFDYVRVADARQGDERVGSIGSITRRYRAGKKGQRWSMDFAFGGWFSGQGLLNDLETASELAYDFRRLGVRDLYAEKITADCLDVDKLSSISADLGEVSVAEGDVTLGNDGIKIKGSRLKIIETDGTVVGLLDTPDVDLRLWATNGSDLELKTELGEGGDIFMDSADLLRLEAVTEIQVRDKAETDDLNAYNSTKDIGADQQYDEIHASDLYGATHCYDRYDDLALVSKLRPCDDNPRLISTGSLPDFLKPSRDYALTKRDIKLKEQEARQRARLYKALETERDPARRRRLQGKLWAVGSDHQQKLDAFAHHFDEHHAHKASVTRTAFFALGTLKQVALKLKAIEQRLAELEGRGDEELGEVANTPSNKPLI